jgi:hypothetical protein
MSGYIVTLLRLASKNYQFTSLFHVHLGAGIRRRLNLVNSQLMRWVGVVLALPSHTVYTRRLKTCSVFLFWATARFG